ncbi:alpha/beta hydrolase [Amycolatopsis sp. 195334CR]|uniref:alpha/beta hydrolase n=1 Tax=Amycolatopsis sp. 195334CR TaxID=2814588 RepID=UPI001A8C2552|nr:alpha/beta hydrolase [Amycolatopsis sp. 195334CR]MBN6039889.1 alpha/beta hydrolase [Amycolatopsis sp. 195334CR]
MRELDLGYSPSAVARDPGGSLRRYRSRGDDARARLDVDEAVRYGRNPGERCHVFPGGPSALVFVHGGHWQESGIDDACFAASDAVANGYTFVAVGYGLAPARTVPEMITSVARALTWLAESGARYGIDPHRLHVAGSSAGAHLLAAALAVGDTPRVRGACLLSGLYDLTEVPYTYVNEAVGLTPEQARECSPVRMPVPACDSVLLAAGQHETPTYLRQHEEYLAHLSALGVPVTGRIVPGRDHFDLPLDLADPATPLGRACLARWRTTEGPVTSR